MKNFVAFLVVIALIAGLSWLLFGRKTVDNKPDAISTVEQGPSAEELAFKPIVPEPVTADVIAGRDQVVYRAINNPEKSAKLVITRYQKPINKVANDMVKFKKIKKSEKQGLIDAMEGINMIESGGDFLAKSAQNASGPWQLKPDTAWRYGKLKKIDLVKSDKLWRKVRAGNMSLYPALCKVDERYDIAKSTAAAARYLVYLYGLYGRWDFAICAYHGGPGSVGILLDIYMLGNYDDIGTYKENIANYNLTYQQIFFDCSPTRNPGTYTLIRGTSSDGSDFHTTYYWNVVAAEKALELYRKDKKTFRAKQYSWKHPIGHRRWELVPELVWHPKGKAKAYANADALKADYAKNELVYAPNNPEVFGFTVDSSVGECVGEADRQPFRGARPETIGLLMTIGYLTRLESERWDESLTVTTLVRTVAYQKLVKERYPNTASEWSIHVNGYSLDISRMRYESDAQRSGFQYALDYLKYCGYICYGKENHAIHLTLKKSAAPIFKKIYQDGIAHLASLEE